MITPLEVFCCYAREDQEMLVKLKKHLAPLVRQGKITIWSDVDLRAGTEWEKELHHHLESADIILLLISPDFMASDYCYSAEMERALVRHTKGSARESFQFCFVLLSGRMRRLRNSKSFQQMPGMWQSGSIGMIHFTILPRILIRSLQNYKSGEHRSRRRETTGTNR